MAFLVMAGIGQRAVAAPAVEVYGRLPAVELMRLSPDGQRLAFVAVSGEQRKLFAADLHGKVLIQAPVGQTKVLQVRWVGEDHLLVTTSATADLRVDFGYKYELETVYDIDLTASKAFTIFQGHKSIAGTVFGAFGTSVEQGRPFGFFGGVTFARTISNDYAFEHGWPDLYKVDLLTGQVDLAARGDESVVGWAVAPDGTILANERYDQRGGRWRLMAGDFVGKALVDRSAPAGLIGLEGVGRTPDTVLVIDNSGGRSTVEEVSTNDGSATELFKDVGVDEYLRDPETGLLIGAATSSEPGAVFFDPHLQARYRGARKAFPGLQMRLESFSHDMQRMIVRTEGTGDSGTFWLVDIATGHADPIGAAYPEVKPEDVGSISIFDYRASDGLEMDGVLTLPPGRTAKNLPLVVMPHGGPIGVRDQLGFDAWAQAFASRGYAVFQPNYRGSSGRSSAFRDAGYGEWGRRMLSDISDGVAALAQKGVVDPRRACIVGASYGGYAALAGVTLQHGLYRCAVAVAGIGDLHSFLTWQIEKFGDRSDNVRYWRLVTGANKDGDGALKAVSPSAFAATADAPVLLIHGRDDTVVPIEQSREMAAALKRAGKSVELVEIKGGDHWELHEDARVATFSKSVAFVLKQDPPD
jgi:dipeptidyl aminopeptidase/acylaminoacyl peptidase